LLNICDKFMLMLEQRERSWSIFKALTNNFGPLKALMNNFSVDALCDEQLRELLIVWKD